MNLAQNPGRLVGIFLLLQVIAGVSVNLFLTAPMSGEPGFLVNGPAHAQQIGFSVLLGLLASGLSMAVAIVAYPEFKVSSPRLAIALIALAAVNLAVVATEYVGLMSLVSFSEAWNEAAEGEQALLETAQVIVVSARYWAHYIALILSGIGLLVLYTLLYRSQLVPRVIAVLGLLAVLSQLASVSQPLLGGEVNFAMLAPLGLMQIALSLWLIIRGFRSAA